MAIFEKNILPDSNNSLHQPTFSVVVAVKNGIKTLQQCIDSFVNQTYPYKEIIIMDGGSNDGTIDVIRSNAEVIAYWESKPDRGIAHAWNKALHYAKGEWIIFLGSDDYFYNLAVLETFSVKMDFHSLQNSRVVYGQVNLTFPNGENYRLQGENWHKIRSAFFSEKMMIPHQACFHHHSVFQDIGFFNEDFKIAADYDFLLRILKNEKPLFLANFIVTTMRFGGISSQSSALLAIQDEFDRSLIQNGFKPKGFKRIANITIYKLLRLFSKYAGEKPTEIILDIIRVLLGRRPVWTRK